LFVKKKLKTGAAIPIFIQLGVPLPPLKPMVQSQRGVSQIGEVPHQQQLIKYRLAPVFNFFLTNNPSFYSLRASRFFW
jgi:sorbitol-specific phosphotransferase system component IIC